MKLGHPFALSLFLFYCLLPPTPVHSQLAVDLKPGMDYFDGKAYPEARSYFERLTHDDPGNPVIAYNLGRCYFKTGQIKNAVESLERAVALDEKNAQYHYFLGMAYASYVNEVGMFRKLGVAKKMKSAWFTAATLDEEHKLSQIAVIGFYLRAPGLAGGSLEEGARRMALLKQKYPDEVFPMEGSLAEKQEQFDDAERIFRKTVEADRTPRNLFGLASFLSRMKKYDEAVALIEEYLTLNLSWDDPSKALAYFMLGSIFSERKMNAEAMAAFQLAKTENNIQSFDEQIQARMKKLN